MIYIFGCSVCKWFWPMWPDWLKAYGHQVRNFAYPGYGSQNVYWNLVNTLDDIDKEWCSYDEVIIIWPAAHRIMQWYDQEWVDTQDVRGFFPNDEGRIWFSKEPFLGMYRTHPDYPKSLAHGIIENINLIYQTQTLLEHRGIKYRMAFNQNQWLDVRPIYRPEFQLTYGDRTRLNDGERAMAQHILNIEPVSKMVDRIDWHKFIGTVDDPRDPDSDHYQGIWEFFISKKEYVMYKHDTDHHACAVAQHDYALQKILHQDADQGHLRQLSLDISRDCMSMEIPAIDLAGEAESELMLAQYRTQLTQHGN